MNEKTRYLLAAMALTAIAALGVGCGSDNSPNTPATPIAVSGTAAKDVINAATVNLHSFTAAGGMGSLVAGPFTTDANGAWSGEVPAGTSASLLVVVNGGSYSDESTGNTINVTQELYGIWRPSTAKGNASPVTHAIVLNAQQRVAAGATVANALTGAIAAMETALGYDATSVTPLLPTKSPAQTPAEYYALFLAGFSEILNGNAALNGFTAADVWQLVIALIWDMSDGVMDGFDVFGNAIMVDPDGTGSGTPINWPALDATGIGALIAAANNWGAANSVGFTIPPIDLTEFGDTDPVTGGETTVTGSLSVSGSDVELFGSPFAPTIAAYATNAGTAAFSTGTLDGRVMIISLLLSPDTILTVSAGAGESAWAASGALGSSVPGMSVSRNGNLWTVSFEGVVFTGAVGASGTLVFNGTLTFDVVEEN